LDFVPKFLGSPCDDFDIDTDGDVCDGNGQCIGARMTCPADQVKRVRSGESFARAHWEDPIPQYSGLATFAVSGSHNSGDAFFE
jgi:hypothetical protein